MEKLRLSDFDYQLPENLIAQDPVFRRSDSRLMVLDRKDRSIRHMTFCEVPRFFHPDDLLVLNNTKVFKARLFARKLTGGRAEFLFLRRLGGDRWQALMRGTGRFSEGQEFEREGARFRILKKEAREDSPLAEIEVEYPGDFDQFLDQFGVPPLPPYIKRPAREQDSANYQTVFAKFRGASAVPTAGLHFTEELMRALEQKGVRLSFITLHVGFGTFQPVKKEAIEEHEMHEEDYEISAETADAVNETRDRGRRVFACGTTVVRALESSLEPKGRLRAAKQNTNLFIHPPAKIRSADCLITNFHAPRSTLLMLVSAFAGYDFLKQAYQEAVREKYRFYSYGDAMLIV